MGTWATAVTELQELLNDQGNDRYCYRKKVFGNIDGTNTSFKTFEFRRVTNFTDSVLSAAPLGIYSNGVRLSPSAVASDDLASGEFTLNVAPAKGTALVATYYYQWFELSELQSFLTSASRWLQNGDDYTTIPSGLNQGALYYAAQMALLKMAMRWATRASNSFLLDDQPKQEALALAKTYSEQAAGFEKSAEKYRDDYYTKSGQSLAAFSTSNWGSVSAVTPRR